MEEKKEIKVIEIKKPEKEKEPEKNKTIEKEDKNIEKKKDEKYNEKIDIQNKFSEKEIINNQPKENIENVEKPKIKEEFQDKIEEILYKKISEKEKPLNVKNKNLPENEKLEDETNEQKIESKIIENNNKPKEIIDEEEKLSDEIKNIDNEPIIDKLKENKCEDINKIIISNPDKDEIISEISIKKEINEKIPSIEDNNYIEDKKEKIPEDKPEMSDMKQVITITDSEKLENKDDNIRKEEQEKNKLYNKEKEKPELDEKEIVNIEKNEKEKIEKSETVILNKVIKDEKPINNDKNINNEKPEDILDIKVETAEIINSNKIGNIIDENQKDDNKVIKEPIEEQKEKEEDENKEIKNEKDIIKTEVKIEEMNESTKDEKKDGKKINIDEIKIKKIPDEIIKKKFEKIINRRNVIKIYFNKWKDIVDLEEIKTIENGVEKVILLKKKLILKKDKQIDFEDNKIFNDNKDDNISKKDLEKEEKNKVVKNKLLKIINNRILENKNDKDILKKYYNIWKKSFNEINESKKNKLINDKINNDKIKDVNKEEKTEIKIDVEKNKEIITSSVKENEIIEDIKEEKNDKMKDITSPNKLEGTNEKEIKETIEIKNDNEKIKEKQEMENINKENKNNKKKNKEQIIINEEHKKDKKEEKIQNNIKNDIIEKPLDEKLKKEKPEILIEKTLNIIEKKEKEPNNNNIDIGKDNKDKEISEINIVENKEIINQENIEGKEIKKEPISSMELNVSESQIENANNLVIKDNNSTNNQDNIINIKKDEKPEMEKAMEVVEKMKEIEKPKLKEDKVDNQNIINKEFPKNKKQTVIDKPEIINDDKIDRPFELTEEPKKVELIEKEKPKILNIEKTNNNNIEKENPEIININNNEKEIEKPVLNEEKKVKIDNNINIDNKNIKNKLMNIIKHRNPLKNHFKKWKNPTNSDKINLIENEIENKIISKKIITLKNEDIKKDLEEKLLNLINKRIINNNKDILKKYYNIWKVKDKIIDEVINKNINKKVISLKNQKPEEDNGSIGKEIKIYEIKNIAIINELLIKKEKDEGISKDEIKTINNDLKNELKPTLIPSIENQIEIKNINPEESKDKIQEKTNSKIIETLETVVKDKPKKEEQKEIEEKPKEIKSNSIKEQIKTIEDYPIETIIITKELINEEPKINDKKEDIINKNNEIKKEIGDKPEKPELNMEKIEIKLLGEDEPEYEKVTNKQQILDEKLKKKNVKIKEIEIKNKLIKIINKNHPLNILFNKWKNSKELGEIENINSVLSKKKISTKKNINLPNKEEVTEEIDNKSPEQENTIEKKTKAENNLNQLINKISKKHNLALLRKYNNKWIIIEKNETEPIFVKTQEKTSFKSEDKTNSNKKKDSYNNENKITKTSKLDIINSKNVPIEISETTSININSIEKKSIDSESKIVRPIEIKIYDTPIENENIFEKRPKKFIINIKEITFKNKMIKIINICNPLKNFFKKWKYFREKDSPKLKDKNIIKRNMIVKRFQENEDIKKPLNQEEKQTTDDIDNNSNKKLDNVISKESEIKIDETNIKYINDIKTNEGNEENKNSPYKTYKLQKKRFIENVNKRIKLKNIIIKILQKYIKVYFNKWKNKSKIPDNSNNIGNEYNTIITTTVHHKTHIPKRKYNLIKEFQKENIEEEKPKHLTISKPKKMDILLNKMSEKRKRKLLIKYIIKTSEKNEEVLKFYLNIWKNNNKNKNLNKDKDETTIINTKNKRIITTKKDVTNIEKKISVEEKDSDSINNERSKKETKSNLYIRHRPHALNYIHSTKNHDKKKNINYNQQEVKKESITPRLNEKGKKIIITEKTKIRTKYIKEETKKFNLPNPKKEINKEYTIIIPPKQRQKEFDTLELNLPLISIPKIPQKKTKKIETDSNARYTYNRNRRNYIKFSDILSPIYRTNKRTLDLENNERSSKNNDIITVKRKLKFEKNSSTIDKEEVNTISLKNDTHLETRDFGYRTYTFIPSKKIIKGNIKDKEIIKNDLRNRFKEKEQETEKNDNNNLNIRRRYERRLFSMERNAPDSKSKTIIPDTKSKQFYLDKQCKKEYNKDYNNFILCEEIVYKSYDPTPEKILNIPTIRKPVKKREKIEKKYQNYGEITEERESIFVQKVIKYKERERREGNLFTSPIKTPMTPYKNELDVSTLSPFSQTTRNFFKAKERRLNLFSPEQSIRERRERRAKELIERKDKEEAVNEKDGREREKDIFERRDRYIEKTEENMLSSRIRTDVISPRIRTNVISPRIRTNVLSPRKFNVNDVNFKVKKIIINLPKCPKLETIDYLKNINRPCLKNTIIDNINSLPIKETIDRAKLPDKRFYPKIYTSLKQTQNLVDFHIQFLRDIPHHTFNNIVPKKIYDIISNTNKKLALMKIYYIYGHYKYDKFMIKKIYWNRWVKNVKIFIGNDNQLIHLKNIYGHCFSVEKIYVKEIRCGIHPDSKDYIDCLCLRTRFFLKRILLRQYLLKIIDKRKYYLFLWYKNALGKIRRIYL